MHEVLDVFQCIFLVGAHFLVMAPVHGSQEGLSLGGRLPRVNCASFSLFALAQVRGRGLNQPPGRVGELLFLHAAESFLGCIDDGRAQNSGVCDAPLPVYSLEIGHVVGFGKEENRTREVVHAGIFLLMQV